MSDFLSGLIERASGAAATLERRPRSLFEPEVRSAGPQIRSGGDEAEQWSSGEIEAAAAEPDSRPAPAPMERGAAVHPRVNPESPGVPRQERGAQLPSRETAPASKLQADQRDDALPRRAPAAPLNPPAPAPATLAPRLQGNTQPPYAPQQRVPERPTPAAAAKAAPPVKSETASSERGRVARRSVEPEQPPVPRLRPAQPPRQIPLVTEPARPMQQRAAAPSVLLARAQSQQERSELPRPVGAAPVHISIGRIEVRASTPAAGEGPRPRKQGGPKLGLDEYLRGRNGGGR